MKKSYYELLGVPQDADLETIRNAYLLAMRENHPDQNPDDPKSPKRSRELNTASNTLTNPDLRRKYDEQLQKLGTEQPAGPSEVSPEEPKHATPPKVPPGFDSYKSDSSEADASSPEFSSTEPPQNEPPQHDSVQGGDWSGSHDSNDDATQSTAAFSSSARPRSRTNRTRRKDSAFQNLFVFSSIAMAGLGGICVAIVLLWVVWKSDPLGIIAPKQPAVSVKPKLEEENPKPATPPRKKEKIRPKSSKENKKSTPKSNPTSKSNSEGTKPKENTKQEKSRKNSPSQPSALPDNKSPKAPAKRDPITSQRQPPLAIAPLSAKRARELQKAWAEFLGIPVKYRNSIGMEFQLIPPGGFMMGAPDTDSEAQPYEKPQHRVRITRAFYLGISAVTQQEYEALTGVNPSSNKGLRKPVDHVSWLDANKLCKLLAHKEGGVGQYRLPTEAEWEYACRAGTQTRFPWGDDAGLADQHGWWSSNSSGQSQPVCQKKPNSFGLFDMLGNIREMCRDNSNRKFSGANYYAASPLDDPQGIASGSYRIWRGGYFRSGPNKSYTREDGYPPNTKNSSVGFRVVLETQNIAGRRVPSPRILRIATNKARWDPPRKIDQVKPTRLLDDAYRAKYDQATRLDGRNRLNALRRLAEEVHALQQEENDVAVKYVMRTKSIGWATESGDSTLTYRYMDDFVRQFKIDELQLKVTAVKFWAKLAKRHYRGRELFEQQKKLLDLVVPLAARADREHRFGLSVKLYGLAVELSPTDDRQRHLRKSSQLAKKREARHAEMVKLDAQIDANEDPDKLLKLGKYWCFELGNWQKGLQHLAGGSDASLKKAARLDLAGGGTPEKRLNVGDAWWDLAQAAQGNIQTALFARARHWYEPLFPKLQGLTRKRIEQRLTYLRNAGRPPLAQSPFDATKAKSLQVAWAKYLGVPVVYTNGLGIAFVLTPPGEFTMGHANAKGFSYPRHRVRISRPFYIGKFEVTESQVSAINKNPSQTKTGNVPANLSWQSAARLCEQLSKLDKPRKYRLPTEAEWEYSHRAGREDAGNPVNALKLGWFRENSGGKLHSVGEKPPNPWAVHDTYGNAIEWCQDWFSVYASERLQIDPTGPATWAKAILRLDYT